MSNLKASCMAKFKITRSTAKGKTWKAVGNNPVTGRRMTIQGGQKGKRVGSANPDSERTFDARHEATGMTPKKYVNKLRWDDKAKMGSTVNIPDRLSKMVLHHFFCHLFFCSYLGGCVPGHI